MTTQFFRLNGDQIIFTPGSPEVYRSILFQGGNSFYSIGRWGEMVVQELSRLHCKLCIKVINLGEAGGIKTSFFEKGLTTTAVLQNNFRQTVSGAGKISLQEGQFASLYGRTIESCIYTDISKSCISLDCFWSDEMLSGFLPEQSSVYKLLNVPGFSLPSIIGAPHRPITDTIRRIFDELRYCPYDDELQESSFNELMEEYLLLVLKASESDSWIREIIKPGELEKVYAARDLIEADTTRHLQTGEIAALVGINECTLKLRFRQVTGRSMFKYLLFLRCQKVAEAIVSTDLPIKSFYKEAGYRDVANFLHGFKRQMGCYPSELKK